MADNDEQDETEQTQEVPVTDQTQPVEVAQAAPPTPPPVLSAPPAQPQGAPMVPFTIGRFDPTTGQRTTVQGFGTRATPPDQNAAFWNQLRQRTSNLPIAQAEAAVSAALRFQGQRQYQRDLASGMAPAEALARSAPLIFNAPRQSSLGQAAQFMRAATPTRKFHSVGGVLYRENPDGTATAVSGPAPPKFHTASGVLYREGPNGTLVAATPTPQRPPRNLGPTFDRIKKLEAETDELAETQKRNPPTGMIADEQRDELRTLRDQAGQLKAAPTAPRKSPFPEGTLIRSKKDGKLYRVVNGEPKPVKE